jgi:threonylcarbamoyladenosine tRNA methylthiotransferase MtaB
MKASWEAREQFFESENKEGYIHGFTENYVKVKLRGTELVNTLRNKFDYN